MSAVFIVLLIIAVAALLIYLGCSDAVGESIGDIIESLMDDD